MACYLGLQLGEATAYTLKSGLTRLQIQVRLLHELPDQVELLAMLCGQMEALTMFCNHFWSVKITGCVPLQGGATGWLLLGRAMGWVPQLPLGRGGGLQVGCQVMLHHQIVLLDGLCVQVGPKVELHVTSGCSLLLGGAAGYAL